MYFHLLSQVLLADSTVVKHTHSVFTMTGLKWHESKSTFFLRLQASVPVNITSAHIFHSYGVQSISSYKLILSYTSFALPAMFCCRGVGCTNLMGDRGTSESRREHLTSHGCCRVSAADDEQVVTIISVNRSTQLSQAELLRAYTEHSIQNQAFYVEENFLEGDLALSVSGETHRAPVALGCFREILDTIIWL